MKKVKELNGKRNIGTIDALIRITIGFIILFCATARFIKKPWRESTLFFALFGAMKVGEGIVRFGAMKTLFVNGWNWMKERDEELNDMFPNNPS